MTITNIKVKRHEKDEIVEEPWYEIQTVEAITKNGPLSAQVWSDEVILQIEGGSASLTPSEWARLQEQITRAQIALNATKVTKK